jgi:adenylosuccinate lyase
MPRVNTFFMDQISEHQRDLSNSASQRFIADYTAGFCLAVSRMTGIIKGLESNRQKLADNLRGGGIPCGVMAEPAYILLAETGVSDAHEVIRKITLAAEKEKISFSAALTAEKDVFEKISGKLLELGLASSKEDAVEFFENPQRYRGIAAEKAKTQAKKYSALMDGLSRKDD